MRGTSRPPFFDGYWGNHHFDSLCGLPRYQSVVFCSSFIQFWVHPKPNPKIPKT